MERLCRIEADTRKDLRHEFPTSEAALLPQLIRAFFFGRFVASDHGTRIEGEFRMHPFVKIFMIVWFAFLGVFSVIMLTAVLAGRAAIQGSAVLGLVIPAGMAV